MILTVNLCSFDVSKAFDKVNHFVVFSKLMVSKVPINLIKLLSTWYNNSTSIVNWYGAFSVSYTLRAGVRQGGVATFSRIIRKICRYNDHHNR